MSNPAPGVRPVINRWLLSRLAFLAALVLLTASARANVPGGVVGTTGTYPAVTIVTNSSAGTVTMANGLVTAVIDIATAQILTLTYQGYQVTAGGTGGTDAFYWQGQNSVGEQTGEDGFLTIVTNPSSNSGSSADIMISDLYSNHTSTTDSPDDAYRHFTMFQGSPGIYVTEIMSRPNTYPAGGADIPSFTGKLAGTPFNWIAQDSAGQNLLMPTDSNSANWVEGINSSPVEVSLVNSGLLNGHFNCKYNYAGDFGLLSVTGWCCNNQTTKPNIGIWMIHPSDEYFSCGPKHPEILSQILNLNCTFKGVHFGFGSDLSMAADETWTRVCGPFFLYLNQAPATPVVTGSNPALTGTAQVTLYSDALAQAAAEKGAWPYNWLNDSHWVPASGRGTVTGTLVISDSGNPLASASGMWIGVAIQPASTESPAPTDFQSWGKNLQFWTRTGANGSFTIPNVLPGSNYTLFAFGPGSIGQLQSQALTGAVPPYNITYPATQFSVTVTGGSTTNLGTVTFAPTRVGPTVWEIGVLDRDTNEFRHGQDYWHGQNGTAANPAVIWNPYTNYAADFPNGLTYTVGQSIWQRDWNYAEPNVLNPVTGNFQAVTQTIVFNLPAAPPAGAQASLYLGIAEIDGPSVTVKVNGNNSPGTFTPTYTSDAMIRMESHGIWSDRRLSFAGSLLHSGSNNIQITSPQSNPGYFANTILCDYLRLEIPGYVPPAPASLTVLAGNARNVLNWPPAPGATTYNILRSTTSGTSGYSTLATNVTGPVCGSTPQPAAYIDTTASNGTTYYYEVASVNVVGTSATNSPSASGAPSSGAPGIPAAPTGLAATAGNAQAALTWSASTGASYYIVERSGTSGGPYTAVASSIPSTSCTDTGLTNTENYYYVVAAVNASGTSASSSEVSTLPMPATVASAPTNLVAVNSAGQPYLTWTGVSGANNYVIQRATSAAGPYTVLYQYNVTDYYADTSASPSTTYYYEVAAANVAGMSSFSAPATIVTPPAAPATVTATPGNTQVQLNWSASSGATSYIVESALVSGGPYSIIATTSGVSYVNSGLTNGTPYYYVVAAVNTSGTGVTSAEATATPVATVPLAPTGLTATGSTGAISLNWSASAGATAYTIYRGSVSGGPYSVISSGSNVTTYTNSGLSASSTYYYVVAATNAGGASAYSNEAHASTQPGSVASLSATAGNTQVQLGWSTASGATEYVVQRSLTNGSFATIGNASGLTYTDSNLTNGTKYYYVVAGVSSTGTGANSPVESATPTSAVPVAPTGLTATGSNGAIILNWTAPLTATGYIVYQASVTGGPYTAIATAVSGTTYTDSGLPPFTTYYFVVSATNAGGMSAYSGEASATTQAAALSSLTWDSLGTSPGDPLDGSGSWNTTAALWSNGATDSAWVNTGSNGATFGNGNGAAGTVTLGNVTAPGLIFNPPGSGTYTLTSGTLTLSGSAPSISANVNATIASIVTGTGSLGLAGSGTVTFSGANTFTGTTTIASTATLAVGSAGALQDTTLNFSSGALSFPAATSAATIGGLEGTNAAQSIALANTSGAVALTIGSNNSTTTYSGNLTGSGSVTKAGTGAITLANANYSGATTVNDGGTLTISGGSFGSSGNTITIGVDTVTAAAVMYVTGGTATAGTVNIGIGGNESNSSLYISGNASAVFAATNLASTADTGGQVNIDTTGSVSLGTMSVVRDYGAGNGLIIEAGNVTATALAVEGNSDHTGDMAISGGALTIGNSSSFGAFEIGQGGDGGIFTQTGGSLTYPGTDGLLMSTAAGITSTATITSGTATLTGITLNAANAAATVSKLTLSGGATLYLGSVGLIENQPGANVSTSLGTAIVGAAATWTSLGPITLAGNTTFQTADALSAPHTITLSGVLSGTGALTVTGGGTLILSGNDTYTGSTTVQSGILEITGTISGTTSLSVSSGAVVYLAGGSLSLLGGITNGGLFKLSGTPSLGDGSFINNGVLDLIDGPQSLPAGFVNNGTVLYANSVQVQQIGMSSPNNFTLTIQGYAQHTYQLQRASSLVAPITWTNVGSAQTGNGMPITFTDTSAPAKNGFYKIEILP